MIQKRSTNRGVRYDVRVRDASGRVHTRTFSTKRAAEAYERDQLTKREQGAWTDPRSARTPFDLWARQWLSSDPAKRPKTLATDRNIIERHLVPALGSRPIGSISPSPPASPPRPSGATTPCCARSSPPRSTPTA
jgi:hypothetical protein